MQSLPGFRDIYPEDFAFRRYLLDTWRRVARNYGFREYDAPMIESSALYEKKNSGGEILTQLYRFTDRGDRDISLRPEMTPSLARMVAASGSRYRKPLKWFSIANFFRYERQQKGRLREFIQLNCDILGDASPAADAELLALTIDILRAFGLGEGDFVLRLSDRNAWKHFLEKRGQSPERTADFLGIIDKLERETPEKLEEKLKDFGIQLRDVQEFIAAGGEDSFAPLLTDLEARGLRGFVEPDLTIVRGLAYYTGVVFEVFDKARSFRALAGGGRYDHLVKSLSDGSVDLPAIGMGMGDVVLGHFIDAHAGAAAQKQKALAADVDCEIYVVVAEENRRNDALSLISFLRNAGRRVDFSLAAAKVGKQFGAAEASGARHVVLVGSEWPMVKIKTLATREEQILHKDELADWLKTTHVSYCISLD